MTYLAVGNSIPSRRARISPALSRGYRSGNSIPRHRDRINSCRIGCSTGFTSYPTHGKRCLTRSIRRPRTLITYPCASVIATANAKPLQAASKRDAMGISTQAGSSSESNFTNGISHRKFSSDDRSCRMQRRVRLASKAVPHRHLPACRTDPATKCQRRRGITGQAQPRATTAEIILRMSHPSAATPTRYGIFRSHGQGLGKLCSSRGKTAYFPISDASLSASRLGNRVVSTLTTPCFTDAQEDSHPPQPLQQAQQQTQNAYPFAESLKPR